MKKGYYIVRKQFGKVEIDGYDKKIKGQIEAFNANGLKCDELDYFFYRHNIFLELLMRIPFCYAQPFYILKKELLNADFIYMRRPMANNIYLRRLFKKIKRNNPNVKIIMELPTYPYDKEFSIIKLGGLLLYKDKYNRKRLKGLVDRFAILTEEEEIWGIPTIQFKNGIDFSMFAKRKPTKMPSDEIHICSVSTLQPWHGYERFIDGLFNYYSQGENRNIICHFIGNGPELQRYKRMVEEYNLGEHFVFEGFKSGEELNEVYNVCRLSLGAFGAYKKHLNFICDLKSREALARGIPIVTGCRTDVLIKGKFPYFIEFSNDSTSINIKSIVDFYDEIYKNDDSHVINEIRKYACETLDMRKCMKTITDYIMLD